MNTTLSQSLMDVNADGVRAYGQSALSGPTAGLVRRIGRRRRARAVGAGATAFGVTGALAVGAWMVQERGAGLTPGLVPSGPSVPSVPSLPSDATPSPSEESSVPFQAVVSFPAAMMSNDIAVTVEGTMGIDADEFLAAVQDALPPEAQGNPEGWLAPGNYEAARPEELAEEMVARTLTNLQTAGVAPEDYFRVLTVASLVAREAPLDKYRPLVAGVIYNRLAAEMPLELDSTVQFVMPRDGVFPPADRTLDSPYNTYMYHGLPPGPIASVSFADIHAAVNPAQSEWLYFVVVNERSKDTRFAANYEDHLANVDLMLEWFAENGWPAPVASVSPGGG